MRVESRVLSYSIFHLIELMKQGRINLFPKFQRDLVWNDTHKSKFIETILMGLPFPEIFLTRDPNETDSYEVVDGQQRLATIYQYVAGSPEFKVRGIKQFAELDEREKRAFFEYSVVIRELRVEEESDIYEVFQRINSVRYALNAIELTNALYEGEFINTAREIADKEMFGDLEIFTETEFTRKKDLEFVLLVMATVEEGGYFSGTKEVEIWVKKYDAEYPNKDQMRTNFRLAVDLIRRADLKPDSLWLRKANLFTLLVELIEMLNSDRWLDSNRLRQALQDFEAKLLERRNENKETDDFAAYYYYLFQSTNSRLGRHTRAQLLRPYLESTSDVVYQRHVQEVTSREAIFSSPKHTVALVPLGAGYHQSMDVFARGRSIDTGLLAEALIYYEQVLIQVDSPVQFSQLIGLLIQQGLSLANIIALVNDGVIGIYNFAFTTNPYVEFLSSDTIQIHGLYNIQDQTMLRPNSFFKRFLGYEPLRSVIEDGVQFDRFAAALEGRVVEVKASEIGADAIDNAYQDFLNPKRSALMAQELVNEIYRIKSMGKAPQITVDISETANGSIVSWNLPLNQLPAVERETRIKAAVTLPLSTAAEANKYLWASDKLKCDLYLARPVSMLVGDKLYEAGETALKSKIKTRNVIDELEAHVEFPDLRRYVNLDKIDFPQILEIRKKATKFREWLQEEAGHDRDAIVAYHKEVATASGFRKIGRTALRLFGVFGGAAVGASVGAALGNVTGAAEGSVLGAAAGKGVTYLTELAASIGEQWRPVVFGDWYSAKIARLLDEESNDS